MIATNPPRISRADTARRNHRRHLGRLELETFGNSAQGTLGALHRKGAVQSEMISAPNDDDRAPSASLYCYHPIEYDDDDDDDDDHDYGLLVLMDFP